MSWSRVTPGEWHIIGDVVGTHSCPTCGSDVTNYFRPGRGRLYCSNACRQRAYRWRRAHGVRTFVERDGPSERLVNDRRHAVRNDRDPVAKLRDRRERETTACGVFARPIRGQRVTHDRFVPEHPWSCKACSQLISAGPPGTGVPDFVQRYAASLAPWTESGTRAGTGWWSGTQAKAAGFRAPAKRE